MLMIPQSLDLNLGAYEHAAMYAQQLSEGAEALGFGTFLPTDHSNEGPRTELEETSAKAAETFSELVEALRELYDANAGYIKSTEETLNTVSFAELWRLADSFAEKPKQSPGLKEEVISWGVANFDPKGDSETVIRKAYRSREQVLEMYAKVNKSIKLSQAVHTRRQRVAVPETEAEMVKRAERFTKQNRKVISELSRI